MSHADDTIQMWNEMLWIESVCDRWNAFFSGLEGEPSRTTALCALGILLVTGKSTVPPQSVGGTWYSFFASLAGRHREAKELCALGIQMVTVGLPKDNEPIRAEIRAIMRGKPVGLPLISQNSQCS